jgi:putative PEP-CTERM system TPR-repeat lipoprotein
MLLGQVHLASADLQAAEKELGRAEELGANDNELRPLLAKVRVVNGDLEALEEMSADGLEGEPRGTVLAAMAMATVMRGDLDQALEEADEALRVAPDNTYAIAVKARVFGARGEFTLMREQLEKLLQLDPSSAEGWLLLGDVEAAQGHSAKAEEAYSASIDNAVNPLQALLRRAFVRIELGNFDTAQQDVDRLLKVAPLNPSVNYAQGVILFQRQQMQDAVSAFAIAERDRRRHPLALLYAGIAHYSLGNLDQAAGYANQFHSIAPEHVAGRKLLATVLLAQRDFERAEELIRPVVASSPQDIAAMNILANALISLGETDEAIDILGEVARLEPDSSAAQIRLGASLMIKGDSAGGVEKLQTALELNPEFQQADIILVMNYLEQGKLDEAIAAAKAYRARNPTEVTPLNLLGRVYRRAGLKSEARETFERALTIAAGDPNALSNLAQMALEEGDPTAARAFYEQILDHDANSLPALLQLAQMDARENNLDSAIERLELAVSAHPGALQPKVALARAYMVTGRPEQVAVVFSELDEAEKSVPAVLNEMARAQLALGEYASARYSLGRLESMVSSSAALHHRKAVAAAGLQDVDTLQRELERSIEADPDYLPSRLAMARLRLSRNEIDAAQEHIDVLAAAAPDFPDVLILQSRLAQKRGDDAAALQYAQRAFDNLPNSTTAMNLSRIHTLAGRDDAARSLLEKWVAANADDGDARRALAELYMRDGRTDAVIDQYMQILEKDDDNLVALNNLAWYLLESDPQRALSYARRAQGVAPDSADVLDTLALAEYHNGDLEIARRTLRRALELRPDDPSLLYHRAMFDAEAGERDRARATLQDILGRDRDFPERDKAQQLLASL